MFVSTNDGEEPSSPNGAINGDNRPNESPNTTTTSPSQAVPAPRQRSTTGDATKQRRNNNKRLRDFLQKTIFYSQNIQGSGKNKKEKLGPYKFEYIIDLMKTKGIDIYLVQETWLPDDFEKEIKGHYIFHHGTPEASDSNTERDETAEANEPTRGHTRGGVAIILSPRATAAWKKAGQPEPTRSGVILGCARFITLSLHFTDHLNETVKINTASIYHPTGVTQQERSEFLDQLDTLYDKLDGEDEILVTGCDINASIGNRGSIYARADSTEETQYDNVVGPHGIDYLNEAGVDLSQVLKAKNLAAATTFFEHKKYSTWRTNQRSNAERREDGDEPTTFADRTEYQLDHFFIQRKHLNKVINARRIGDGAPSDHAAIQLILRIASKMTRNKTRFNTRNRGEKSKKKVKLDWKLLRIEAIRLAYNASIKTIISKEERNQENQLSYEDFVAATMQAAEEHIEGNGRISKDWFTTSEGKLNKAIKLRNYWYDIWATTSVAGARVKCKEARSELRKMIRKGKKKMARRQSEGHSRYELQSKERMVCNQGNMSKQQHEYLILVTRCVEKVNRLY